MKSDKDKTIFGQVKKELFNHIAFTVFGTFTGIILFILFKGIPKDISFRVFYILHPIHVLFSGMVTASLYELHRYHGQRRQVNLIVLFIVGYAGAIGIATLSDSLIPYVGEVLLDMPEKRVHLGFIEKWWLINPLALLGILIAYFCPKSKVPHAFHVLLSTYASIFHIIMALGDNIPLFSYFVIMLFLFIAVWLPCCLSDIIYPVILAEIENRNKQAK